LLGLAAWEGHARGLGLVPGDIGDFPSGWVEARRAVDDDPAQVVLLGDSRLLFGIDLSHAERLTGRSPVQLSMPGTNAQYLLEHLAQDATFRGLAIVSFSEDSTFSGRLGPRAVQSAAAFSAYRFESPSARAGYLLYRRLARRLAFLDENYRLSVLARRLDRDHCRPGTQSPYLHP
jgi:hypothetical protein